MAYRYELSVGDWGRAVSFQGVQNLDFVCSVHKYCLLQAYLYHRGSGSGRHGLQAEADLVGTHLPTGNHQQPSHVPYVCLNLRLSCGFPTAWKRQDESQQSLVNIVCVQTRYLLRGRWWGRSCTYISQDLPSSVCQKGGGVIMSQSIYFRNKDRTCEKNIFILWLHIELRGLESIPGKEKGVCAMCMDFLNSLWGLGTE
jgi:hypothetical protein